MQAYNLDFNTEQHKEIKSLTTHENNISTSLWRDNDSSTRTVVNLDISVEKQKLRIF